MSESFVPSITENPIGPIATPPPAFETVLTSGQLDLLRVLANKDESAAGIYFGALRARSDPSNPDRLALASHGIRELINKIPNYFDVVVKAPGDLGSKVNELRNAWRREPASREAEEMGLSPRFVAKLKEFFAWQERIQPARAALFAATIQELDLSPLPAPDPIKQRQVEEWDQVRDFFVKAAHHKTCTEEEFNHWLIRFESFVLGLVKPKTFDNANALDALIAEGESNA